LESLPFSQLLDHKEAFHTFQFKKQADLVRYGKLKIESYYNTLPSGDIVSDTELDNFLCEEFFAEEFEFTVIDQSSAGGNTFRFSMTKKQNAQLSSGKDFLKFPQAEQVGPRGQKLKKISTFSMGDKLHKVKEANEDFASGDLDYEVQTPSMSSKASGEKSEPHTKRSGYLTSIHPTKKQKYTSMKNIDFILGEDYENMGFDIPSPGMMSESHSVAESPFRIAKAISPLGKKSPSRLKKFELVPESIAEEYHEETSENSLHQSGLLKFQSGINKDSKKLSAAHASNESGKFVVESDAYDADHKSPSTTRREFQLQKSKEFASSSFPELDTNIPVIRLTDPAISIVMTGLEEEEPVRSTTNKSPETQDSRNGVPLISKEADTIPSTRTETLSEQSPPGRPPSRHHTPEYVPDATTASKPVAPERADDSKVLPEVRARIEPFNNTPSGSGELIDDIERKIQQAKVKTMDLEDKLKSMRSDNMGGSAYKLASVLRSNPSLLVLDQLEDNLMVNNLSRPTVSIFELNNNNSPEGDEFVDHGPFTEQSSVLLGLVNQSSVFIEPENQATTQKPADFIDQHGDSLDDKSSMEMRRNSDSEVKSKLKAMHPIFSLTNSPKLQASSLSIRQSQEPRLNSILGLKNNSGIPKTESILSSSSNAKNHLIDDGEPHLCDLTSKFSKTHTDLSKQFDANIKRENLLSEQKGDARLQAEPKELPDYLKSSISASRTNLANLVKPFSSLLSKNIQQKTSLVLNRSSNQNSPEKRPSIKPPIGASKTSTDVSIVSSKAITDLEKEKRKQTLALKLSNLASEPKLAARPAPQASKTLREQRQPSDVFEHCPPDTKGSPKGLKNIQVHLLRQGMKAVPYPAKNAQISNQNNSFIERRTVDPITKPFMPISYQTTCPTLIDVPNNRQKMSSSSTKRAAQLQSSSISLKSAFLTSSPPQRQSVVQVLQMSQAPASSISKPAKTAISSQAIPIILSEGSVPGLQVLPSSSTACQVSEHHAASSHKPPAPQSRSNPSTKPSQTRDTHDHRQEKKPTRVAPKPTAIPKLVQLGQPAPPPTTTTRAATTARTRTGRGGIGGGAGKLY
jgi:hypothetical protein